MQNDTKRKKLRADGAAIHQLTALFSFVNNFNKSPDLAMRGGVYKALHEAEVYTATFDGWEVGYKIEDKGMVIRRKIFLKCEQPLAEIPEDEKNPVMAAVFEVFLEKGQSMPQIEQVSPFTVLLTQDVMPLLLVEKNPNLVSKGPLVS